MGQAQSAAQPAGREEQERLRDEMRSAIAAGSTEDVRRLLEGHPQLIYVHTKEGLNIWHLAAQSGEAKARARSCCACARRAACCLQPHALASSALPALPAHRAQAVEMVATAVADALSHQRQGDKALAAVNAGAAPQCALAGYTLRTQGRHLSWVQQHARAQAPPTPRL